MSLSFLSSWNSMQVDVHGGYLEDHFPEGTLHFTVVSDFKLFHKKASIQLLVSSENHI